MRVGAAREIQERTMTQPGLIAGENPFEVPPNPTTSDHPTRRTRTASASWLWVVLLFLVPPGCDGGLEPEADPPHPPSPVILDIEWAPRGQITYVADDSDNWPMTWADDGNLYTAYGDGWGFEPYISGDGTHPRSLKLSLGFGKVVGDPDDFQGINIRSTTGERTGNGRRGKKASGLLMVDGVLYMLVRNADLQGQQCTLAWSEDRATSWTWVDWRFEELGYCVFLNFGRDYSGARDDYVYMYSPDTPDAYHETDDVVLARVPRQDIVRKEAYEFFAGFDADGEPEWSEHIEDREPVFSFPGGANRMDVSYNPGIGRYLMTMRSRARAGGLNQFSIFDAPEPWGPWTTVYYTERWNGGRLSDFQGGWGESQSIPTKWISDDGRTVHLVFAGNDHFAVRRARLILEPS
jgi:hypothetical protein